MLAQSNSPLCESALYRRVAIALLSFLLPCYIVAMIDRLNVGYAKLQFMSDLKFDEAVFGMAAGILYVGYIIFEIPSNLILERVGIRLTLLRIMTLWGAFSMAMAFAGDRWGFYGFRFLIGAAEAGFFPGMIFYFTLWFPTRYHGRIISLLAVAVPLSGVIAAPLSSWIMAHMAGIGGLRGWQWLFLIEGAPAIALGVAAYFVLPDGPANARFLSPAEKARIANDLALDKAREPDRGGFKQALRQPRTWILGFIYFAFFSAQSILLLWIPTLLRNSGVHDLVEIGWRGSAISIVGAIGMGLVGWNSDRTGDRRWHLIACGSIGTAAFLLLPLAAHSPDGTSLCLMAASISMFSYLALFWTVPASILGNGARAGGIALVSSIGSAGSALSPAFIGWTQVLTGSLFGAIAVLALIFFASLSAIYVYAPTRARGAARAAHYGAGSPTLSSAAR